MKRAAKILILFFLCMALYAQEPWNGEWSDAITISDGDTPDFDIHAPTGTLHILSMLTNSVYGGIIYTVLDSTILEPNGEFISQEEVPIVNGQVPGFQKDKGGWFFGASIAVDRHGYPHICYRVCKDENDYIFDLYYITKNESGWSNSVRISSDVKRGNVVRLTVDDQDRVHILQSALAENVIDIQPPVEPWGKVTYYQVYHGVVQTGKTKIVHDPDYHVNTKYRVDNRFEIDSRGTNEVHLILGSPFPVYLGKINYYYSTNGCETINHYGEVQNPLCISRNGDPDIFLDTAGNVHICYGAHNDGGLNHEYSIRYVRMSGNKIVEDRVVNPPGSLVDWGKWGLSSVASSDDGQYVDVAYLTEDGGELWASLSHDFGATWDTPVYLSYSCGGQDGRNKHLIRAYRNHFYLVYPHNFSVHTKAVRLRILRDVGDFPPDASAGGPYTGSEGSPLQLNMSGTTDTGQNSGIKEYAWDWNQDGQFDFIANSSIAYYSFTDDFNGEVVLRVTDNSGHQTDFDTTTVLISNVPPTINIGANLVKNEGDTLIFTASVFDPGNDGLDIDWDFGDGNFSNENSPKYIYVDEGEFRVVAFVTDDDGGTDTDSITVTVSNVAPVAEAGGLYTGPVDGTIHLVGSAYDPGINDRLSFIWDLDDDGVFETDSSEVTVSYPALGLYTVWLKVMDDDGGIGIDSALVSVSKEAPFILSIADQIVDEGETFYALNLDHYVVDLDHSVEDLTWSYSGNQELLVTLENHELSVVTPDSEWFGRETITLIVTDPVDLKDTTAVRFTVNPINDPPVWTTLPDHYFDFHEDSTLRIPLNDLASFVTDVDDPPDALTFNVSGNVKISFHIDETAGLFMLNSEPNWFGVEQLQLIVSDTSNAFDTISIVSEVLEVPDPPDAFLLINPLVYPFPQWPDSITCNWYSTTDPDSGNQVYYKWMLKGQGGYLIKQVATQQDTFYTYYPDTTLGYGTYLWSVTAYDAGNHSRESSNFGAFLYEMPTGVDVSNRKIPDVFSLCQNYPNPFNPETKITFLMPVASDIRLTIFNQLGQIVSVLKSGNITAGEHSVIWNAVDSHGYKVPAGVYFYRLEAGGNVFLKKMILIR